jgi:hypothetical protein
MDAKQALKQGIDGAGWVSFTYLEDLTDADILVRAIPDTNHIAWQLGHLIQSEHQMLEAIAPGSMPKLPEGFKERHSKKTAASDNPQDFLGKAEYLKLAKEQRAGTWAVLEKLSEADLDTQSPESLRGHWPTFSSVFTMQGTHWLMHAGQWALIRRKLGKPPLF